MELLKMSHGELIFASFWLLLSNFPTTVTAIEASIDYDVKGGGFHRTIRYSVKVDKLFRENCHVALHLSPDPTLYVNVDELANLGRNGRTMACSEGEIDVELFAESAKEQNITICGRLEKFETILSLPIHQRYRMPRRNEKYINVTWPEPTLLVGCRDRIKEYPVSNIDLCGPCVDLSLKWRQIPYKISRDNYTWTVAVGDLSHREYVTNVTLIAVCLGTLTILGALWTTIPNARKKKE